MKAAAVSQIQASIMSSPAPVTPGRTPGRTPRGRKYSKAEDQAILDFLKKEFTTDYDAVAFGGKRVFAKTWEEMENSSPHFVNRSATMLRDHFHKRIKPNLIEDFPEKAKAFNRTPRRRSVSPARRKTPKKVTPPKAAQSSEESASKAAEPIFSDDEDSTSDKVKERPKAPVDVDADAREVFQMFFLLVIGVLLFCLGTAERWGGISAAAYKDRFFGNPGTVLIDQFNNFQKALKGYF